MKSIIKSFSEDNINPLALDKEYYVVDWSWTPISDGYNVHKIKIRYRENINGYNHYYTLSNFRVYYPYQIYETEKEAQEQAKYINKERYLIEYILKELGLESSISVDKKLDLINKKAQEQGYFEW